MSSPAAVPVVVLVELLPWSKKLALTASSLVCNQLSGRPRAGFSGSPYTNACALESHFPRGARPPARQDVRVLHAYQNGEQVSRTVLYDR